MPHSIYFQGEPVSLSGILLKTGEQAPNFNLVNKSLADISLDNFIGRRKILNIFPSVDTGVCAASVRKFNEVAAGLNNTVVLCISADLPFAQARFCGAEHINNVEMLSTMRNDKFKFDYGVAITSGPLSGLTARAIYILDEQNKIIYHELVKEITHEPNYIQALESLK